MLFLMFCHAVNAGLIAMTSAVYSVLTFQLRRQAAPKIRDKRFSTSR